MHIYIHMMLGKSWEAKRQGGGGKGSGNQIARDPLLHVWPSCFHTGGFGLKTAFGPNEISIAELHLSTGSSCQCAL